jgi:SagB-type dehydrogenase family enzyme
MTSFLSHLHTELRRSMHTRRGATHRPEDVERGVHKSYTRMPRVVLPQPQALDTSLAEVLNNRHSADAGDPAVPLSLQECGTLLGLALQKRADGLHRNYPSGGALYPVETYVISMALESQTPGVFHYNPTVHALERLWDLPEDFDIKDIAKHPESLLLSTLIIFTGVWKRSSAKYGELAYQHTLLEAGHMSENLLLVGTALKLNLRPYAGFNDERIAELLDIDESNEQTVHSITVCK